MEVTLKVRKGLKGVQSKEVAVRSASRGCGRFVFEKGREYIVYASLSGTGRLVTGGCRRTKLLKQATADLWEIKEKKEALETSTGIKTTLRVGRSLTTACSGCTPGKPLIIEGLCAPLMPSVGHLR